MTRAKTIGTIALVSLTCLGVVALITGSKQIATIALIGFVLDHVYVVVRMVQEKRASANPEANMRLTRAAGMIR